MKQLLYSFLSVVFLLGLGTNALGQSPTATPAIRDKETAIRVAEGILAGTYGIKSMEGNRPFKAFLLKGVWKVTGTVPKDAMGDPLFVDIDQERGCIVALGIRYWE